MLLMVFFVQCPAWAVLNLTDETKDGVVKNGSVCFVVTHRFVKSNREQKLVTNTKDPLVCRFHFRPLVSMDGKQGLTKQLSQQTREITLRYRENSELCFDYALEINELISGKKVKSIILLGIGELDSACVPKSLAQGAFSSVFNESKTGLEKDK